MPLFEAVRGATDDAPEAAELWQVLHAQKLGPLAPELDTHTATDILWIFNDPAHYAALVTQQGWTEHASAGGWRP